MIDRAGFEFVPPPVAAPTGGTLLAPRLRGPLLQERSVERWGRWLAGIGRAGLILFAVVAVISANREAGLLTFGSVTQLRSAVRGAVPLGAVFWLVPAGATLWSVGLRLSRPAGAGARRWRLGPVVVVAPLAVLAALTLAHISPSVGWADVGFVLAGLALLGLTYAFVLYDPMSTVALSAFVALAGGVQAGIGLGQFALQHDLGLRWLGELSLNPALSGASVLGSAGRVLRAYGLMRHPNALGAILPLSLLAALSLWLRTRGPARLGWLLLAAGITAGLAASFSRAGWLAALAGGGVLLMAGRAESGWRRGHAWASWAPALSAMAVVVVAAIYLRPDLFYGRLVGLLGWGVGVEHWSVTERLAGVHWAWQVIQRWPLWGVGARRYVVAVAQLMQVRPAESLLVDSTPLVLWAELGVVGPLAWLGLGGALVWLGCRRGAASADLALATAWVAAIQVVCLFQAYFWPGHELWQGGLWLGLALGLWARASGHSAGRTGDGIFGNDRALLDSGWRPESVEADNQSI